MATASRDPNLDHLIFEAKPVHRKGESGGAGDNFANAMPITEGLAAFGAANASPRYAPANSQEMVADLTQQAALINGLDNGISPSPFGSSHPDLTRDPDPAERNVMRRNPNRNVQTVKAQDFKEVVLQANYANAFVTDGFINGQQVTFLVDTGATQVSIPQRIANYLQLEPEGRGVDIRTASGLVRAYETILNEVKIGDIALDWVGALINPSDRSNQILLGMSALKKLEFTHRDGQLILRQISK